MSSRQTIIIAFIALLAIPSAVERSAAQVDPFLVISSVWSDTNRSGNSDLIAASLGVDGTVTSSISEPYHITAQDFNEFDPVAIPDGRGGVYVLNVIEYGEGEYAGDRDLILRHLQADGTPLASFGEADAVLVVAQSEQVEENPHLIRLDGGDLIIAYEIAYTGGDYAGDRDIAAIRITPSGDFAWEEPVWIASTNKVERLASLLPGSADGAVAIVESSMGPETPSDVEAVHLTGDGLADWGGGTGRVVVAGSAHDERHASAISDGAGGAFIAYEIAYGSGPRRGDIDVLAQRIDLTGLRQWVDATRLPIVSSNSQALETSPQVSLDTGGILVAFDVSFSPGAVPSGLPAEVVGVQRMSMQGVPLFNGGERAMLISVKGRTATLSSLIPCGTEQCLVLKGTDAAKGLEDVYGQRISIEGELQWGDRQHAIPLFRGRGNRSKPAALADRYGGMILFAEQPGSTEGGVPPPGGIVAQRILSTGALQWGPSGQDLLVSLNPPLYGPPAPVRIRN